MTDASAGLHLRPLVSGAFPPVVEAPLGCRRTARWEFGHRTPTPSSIHERIWADVVHQVVAFDGPRALGLLQICHDDPHSGWACLEAIWNPSDNAQLARCVSDYVDIVLDLFPYRKLYLYSFHHALAVDGLALGADWCPEGRLANHALLQTGQYVDLIIMATYRAS
jgi:hypothetical protein